MNDDGVFAEHYSLMYPPEMLLESTNVSKAVCTFLDLRISVFRGNFRYKSYDKRNDFNFSISNYPNLKGNIPNGPSYGVYISQLVRFCDINQDISSFITDVKNMTAIFLNQGFDKDILKETFLKFSDKNLFKWGKYGSDITTFSDKIFSLT